MSVQEERIVESASGIDDAATSSMQQQLPLILLRITAVLSSQNEPVALAGQVVQRLVTDVSGLDGAAVWLWSPDTERFHLAAIHTVEGINIFDPAASDLFALRLHEGHVGKAVASKQPLVFSDATSLMHSLWDLETPNVAALREAVSRIPTTLHVVSLPLLVNDTPVGALDLYANAADAPFDLTGVSILQLFAEQLAGMLVLTRGYSDLEAKHRRLQAFDAVVTAINDANDVEQTLNEALAATLRVTGLQHGLIALIDDKLAHVEVVRGISVEQAGIDTEWYVDDPPLVTVIERMAPDIQELRAEHPWRVLVEQSVTHLLLAPLVAGNALVGVLGLGGSSDLADQIDWPVLTAIASQIGIAAAHYQLYTLGQRERRKLAGVIASIAEGVLLFDRAGQAIMANEAAMASLGSRQVQTGMSLEELTSTFNLRWLDGRPMTPEETPIARALQGRVCQNDEILVQANGDDIILSTSTAPLLAEDGTIDGAVVVFRDVTAQKRRAAVRDEFLAVAAHELRAPLAAIKGYTDLLVKREIQRADATERDRKGIMMLSAQIDHLVRLVDNILDLSRIDTGRMELYLQAVDLIALVEACIDRISVSNINHNIFLKGPPTLEILGDQLRLQQVFTNLLANAVRYSAPGTDIEVEVWTETCVSEDDALRRESSETSAVVAVRDRGVGIPPEAQGQVFDRYFRANTSLAASGLGLGLYLCREIISRHGGRISLDSTPGQGTTFYVTLPLSLQRPVVQTIGD